MGASGNRVLRRRLTLWVGALAAFAIWAAPAQAVEWLPTNTAITGQSINTKLEYAGQTIVCNSEFKGMTAGAPSATIILSSWGAFKNCTNATFSAFGSTSVGKTSFSLVATKAVGGGNGVAQIEIPNEATVVFGLESFFLNWCVYTAAGPQTLAGGTFTKNVGSLVYSTTATFKRTGLGSEATCGPAEEKAAKFSAYFGVAPINKLEIK